MMQVCKGDNPLCGWTTDGRFECYCYSPPTDKLSRIGKIVEEADAEWNRWQSCRCPERAFSTLVKALRQIKEIVEE